MKLLLDSHTLLWHALNDPHLSTNARDAIVEPANEVYVSPATFWELAIKVSLGKLTVKQPFEDFLPPANSGFHHCPSQAPTQLKWRHFRSRPIIAIRSTA